MGNIEKEKRTKKLTFIRLIRKIERIINTRLLPDKFYLSIRYKQTFGKKLDWANPQTFNEKLQWLKINDKKPEYTTYVDKYAVREHIANTIGEEYLIPLLGVWNRPEEIDFDKLPNQFVLKCNHDSGTVCICKDKSNFDIKKAKDNLKKSLIHDYYVDNREWPYKNMQRKIIAEKYVVDESGYELKDYKVMCFNGKAHYIRVYFNRQSRNGLNINWYDRDWNFIDIRMVEPPNKTIRHERPKCLEKMIKLSELLAQNIPFARIDWYIVGGELKIGEITLYPDAGFGDFEPKFWNQILGDKLILPIFNSK